MTNHPITPPPELVEKWINMFEFHLDAVVLTEVTQWGADQELEACCKLLELSDPNAREFLCAARRPKPPSLKEQAYDALDAYIYGERDAKDKERTYSIIRRALEALDD